LQKLVNTHAHTGHLASLLLHAADALCGVDPGAAQMPLKAVNAVALSTVFIKHYVERVDVETLQELCEQPPAEGSSGSVEPVVHTLLAAMVRVLVGHQPTAATYLLHLTIIRLLTVMAATQLTQPMISAEEDWWEMGLDEGGEGAEGGERLEGGYHGVHPFLEALLIACESMPPGGDEEKATNKKAAAAAAAAAVAAAGGVGRASGKRVADDDRGNGDMKCMSDAAQRLVCTLLGHYVARQPAPPKMPLYALQPPSKSLLARLTTATTNVFLLPVTMYNAVFVKAVRSAADPPAPLADAAVLVMLILVHYTPPPPGCYGQNGGGGVAGALYGNGDDAAAATIDGLYHPFRAALHGCRDGGGGGSAGGAASSARESQTAGAGGSGGAGGTVSMRGAGERSGSRGMDAIDAAESGLAFAPGAIRVSFSHLYDTLGLCLVDDRSTLLLYSLLHGNTSFLEYCLVRQDMDTVMLPLMEMLYNAPSRTPNQIYILLIIVLILSQDASFNANIHKLVVRDVPWYKERMLRDTTLGSLLVVLLIRTVKYNLSKLRDVYLHTNCLAALANMVRCRVPGAGFKV
jgi:hypothetical protein